MTIKRGEEEYLGRRVGSGVGGGFNDEKPLKRLRSVLKFLKHSPINDRLVYFVLLMINNEL